MLESLFVLTATPARNAAHRLPGDNAEVAAIVSERASHIEFLESAGCKAPVLTAKPSLRRGEKP
jgi:hypothetical protein